MPAVKIFILSGRNYNIMIKENNVLINIELYFYLQLNASDDRGIGIVRGQILSFASTRTIFKYASKFSFHFTFHQ